MGRHSRRYQHVYGCLKGHTLELEKCRNLRHIRRMKNRTSIDDETRAAEVRARFERLLAGHGATVRLSLALGISRQQLHKIWAGQSGLPEWLVVIAELLEKLPSVEWPERWLSAMEKRMTLEKREVLERRISSVLTEIRMSRRPNSVTPDIVWKECDEIVSDARALLVEHDLLGAWENSDLEDAARLIQYRTMPRLALASVARALTVSEQRISGEMPSWHYDEQVGRIAR